MMCGGDVMMIGMLGDCEVMMCDDGLMMIVSDESDGMGVNGSGCVIVVMCGGMCGDVRMGEGGWDGTRTRARARDRARDRDRGEMDGEGMDGNVSEEGLEMMV